MDIEEDRELLGTARLSEKAEGNQMNAGILRPALVRQPCWILIMYMLTCSVVDKFCQMAVCHILQLGGDLELSSKTTLPLSWIRVMYLSRFAPSLWTANQIFNNRNSAKLGTEFENAKLIRITFYRSFCKIP
jgi:hypothetical protein